MWDWIEPEEWVGRYWHRLVSGAESYRHHPEAAVKLEAIQYRLAVFFRGLGGYAGVQLAGTRARASGHRLSLRQRLGFDEETVDTAWLDQAFLHLPDQLDLLPTADLNLALYQWLTAFFAAAGGLPPLEAAADPLARDLCLLRRARQVSEMVRTLFPGLRHRHDTLCAAFRAARPIRSLPPVEAMVEEVVQALLGAPSPKPHQHPFWRFVTEEGESAGKLPSAPPRYRPFLPVPLWGEVTDRAAESREAGTDEDRVGRAAQGDERKRQARKQEADRTEDRNSFAFNPFSTLFSLVDMINVSRPIEDDEEESARKAAEQLDEITVSKHSRTATTRLSLDLDLAPTAMNLGTVTGPKTYPEWDYRRKCYHRDYCVVTPGVAREEGEAWTPDDQAKRRIRSVQRQFEGLRPGLQHLTRQVDGHELDLEAIVRSRCDLAASGQGSDRVYTAVRRIARDLSAGLLMDISLSTDSWVQDRRVIDIEKEALTVFAHGLQACGDEYGIFTFTSKTRKNVRVDTVKDFGEAMGSRVDSRIAALKPGDYTRIGAAVRHVTTLLVERPHRHRLLLLLTDGKPNDDDHYEGRYGLEDSRKAVQEARRQGLTVFGVTIDRKAREYFPFLFGRGAYAILDRIEQLPSALPKIYRQLVQ